MQSKNQLTIVTRLINSEGHTGYGEAIISALKNLAGKRAKILIEEYVKPRTNQQNRYYFGVIVKGYQRYFQTNGVYMSTDQMHEWIKEYIWKDFVDVYINEGIQFRKILTSTRLTTKEWEIRMTQARKYAVKNLGGMQLEEPSEKIDQHIQEWLDHPDGVYYDAEYRNYFKIVNVRAERLPDEPKQLGME